MSASFSCYLQLACQDTGRCLLSFEVKVFCSFESLYACLAYSVAQTQARMKSLLALALYLIVDADADPDD